MSRAHLAWMRMLSAAPIAASVATSACDPQVGPAYRGEPIAVVSGVAETSGAGVTEPIGAHLVWFDLIGGTRGLGVETDFTSGLPLAFDLPITTPPKRALLTDFSYGGRFPDETRIGVGVIAALASARGAESDRAYAVDAAAVVVWVDSDVKPGTFSEAFLGGALRRGFYRLEVLPAAAYVAAHPNFIGCDNAGLAPGECPEDDVADSAAGLARAACVESARRAAGCRWPRSTADRLGARDGLEAQFQLAIDADGEPFAAPRLL